MLIYSTQVPRDLRYCTIDLEDPVGKTILSAARRAASLKYKNKSMTTALSLLERRMTDLDMEQLNHLAMMYMISNQWDGATGQGGIWAIASDIVNKMARKILKTRPMFEVSRV